MFEILLFLLVLTGLSAVISFVLYVKARAAEQEKQENFYRSVHYIALAIFTVLGVLELIVVSQAQNFG